MNQLPFTKMHSLGNDFILIEARHLQSPLSSEQICFLADRRYGIGCDQVVLLKEPSTADADISFYNADGSTALACGNGTRCVAHYLGKKTGTIQTPSFLSQFWVKNDEITISLKTPTFPCYHPSGHGINIGNPHLVLFTDDLTQIDLEELAIPLQFSESLNVEVAQIIAPQTVKIQIWERGVGITPACGSGACAVAVLSLKLGYIKKPPVFIEMVGGTLEVDWTEGSPLLLKGPTELCFKGIIDLS
jgi:diaminopimelate epimerase